jgi:hypothetical protein
MRRYVSIAWIWHCDCGGLSHGVAFSTVSSALRDKILQREEKAICFLLGTLWVYEFKKYEKPEDPVKSRYALF